MPTKGYDAFFQPAGARGRMNCRVCGTACQVSRGRIGPTGFAEAVLGTEQPHDRFVCPHADLPWHNEALALLRRLRPSRTGCCVSSSTRGASSGYSAI